MSDVARNGVLLPPLTVECPNTGTLHLYQKAGFKVEGVRPKSMMVDGQLVDEYYMGMVLC